MDTNIHYCPVIHQTEDRLGKHTQYRQREPPHEHQTMCIQSLEGQQMCRSSIECRVILCHVVWKSHSWSTLNPQPHPPAQRCLGAVNSSRLTLVNTTTHNVPAHTTKDMTWSAVTTHHADTKEDAAQILCEWYNNVHADMIGYILGAQGQTDRPC